MQEITPELMEALEKKKYSHFILTSKFLHCFLKEEDARAFKKLKVIRTEGYYGKVSGPEPILRISSVINLKVSVMYHEKPIEDQ